MHAHHNLSLGVANTLVAIEHGATRVDGSLAGMGAGAGNAPLEVLIAVAQPARAAARVRPVRADGCGRRPDPADAGSPRARRSRNAVAGLRRRLFQLPAARRGGRARHGLDTRDILVELGRRKMVGGQEDMIVDVALDLAKETKKGNRLKKHPATPRLCGKAQKGTDFRRFWAMFEDRYKIEGYPRGCHEHQS